MNAAQIARLSLKELVALDAKIKSAIAAARIQERAIVKQRLAELAESHGFSLGEIFGNGRSSKGSQRAAKYANPADRSQTWTGRGRKPNWIVAGLKKGADVEDFAI
jgi:DNA-binding protein H-NS